MAETAMQPWWFVLLEEQQRSGYADLTGARASVRLPVSDRLLSRVLRERLPRSWPVRDLELRALSGNQIAIRVRLKKPAFLPALTITFAIERQPQLPESPVLILRLASTGLSALAGPALSLLNALPTGFDRDGNRLLLNLGALAEAHGVADLLQLLTGLEVTTEPGRVILAVNAAVPPGTTS